MKIWLFFLSLFPAAWIGGKTKKEFKPPQPQFKKDRTLCPFFGFHMAEGPILLDSSGNQCPLRNGLSPCYMEMDHRFPCWEDCPLRARIDAELKRVILEHGIIFPDEFHPSGQFSWSGMAFRDWLKHVTGAEKL